MNRDPEKEAERILNLFFSETNLLNASYKSALLCIDERINQVKQVIKCFSGGSCMCNEEIEFLEEVKEHINKIS